MAAAEFEKFRYSGPVIGVALAVTLLCCLTLTPALLVAFGDLAFWPFRAEPRPASRSDAVWNWLARRIIARPKTVLLLAAVLMAPAAVQGWRSEQHVSYNFLGALAPTAPRPPWGRVPAPLLRCRRERSVDDSGAWGSSYRDEEGRQRLAELAESYARFPALRRCAVSWIRWANFLREKASAS